MSFQDGVNSSALYLEALTTQLMEGTLIKWGTNHKIREMEIRHGQMIQVQGRFMEEVVLELMISTNDPPKYKVAQSPLSMGQEKILRAEGRAFLLGKGSWTYSTTATSDHSLHLLSQRCCLWNLSARILWEQWEPLCCDESHPKRNTFSCASPSPASKAECLTLALGTASHLLLPLWK